ncbi:MAG: flagellar hook-basal body complex protein, partial [Planctomycetota bacterium]
AFGLDSLGRLVDPSTGYLVQRIGNRGEATDGGVQFQELGDTFISVPLGSAIPGEASSQIEFDGNLPSSASPPVEEVLATFRGFQSGGSAATGASTLNSLGINTATYVAGDVINLEGTNPDGTPFSTTVPADTGTLQDVVDALNTAMTGATAALQVDGSLTVTADTAGESFLTLVVSDDPGNVGGSNWTGNAFFISTDGSDGDAFELSMDIYDERGESHRLTFTFTKETVNSWNVEAAIPSSSGTMIDGSVFNVAFAENGSYAQAGLNGIGDGNIEIQLNGISTPQTLDLNFQELTHLASDFLITQTQDGLPPGNLTSVSVSTSGEMTGLSSNGRALPLAQLAIASFSNPSALDAIGSNYFLRSISSGDAVIGTGASGGRGEVMGGQLERSNVDIAQEFTQLIVAQRGFSANARTITVSDEMLEELTNIIR